MRIGRTHSFPDDTHRESGLRRGRPAELGEKGKERKDTPSPVPFGPDVLTQIRADLGGKHLRVKRPDFLKADIRRCADWLHQCAQHYASLHGTTLQQGKPASSRDMLKLVAELEKVGGAEISLAHDDQDDSLRLFRGGYFDRWPYFLSLKPTGHFREEMQTIIVRFLKAFSNRLGMQDFTEGMYYEWTRDMAEGDLSEMEAHPDTYGPDDIADALYVTENYMDGGPLWKKLYDFNHAVVPLREEELDSFVPESVAENELLSMMRKGFALIAREDSIWQWISPTWDEFYDEEGNAREDADGDGLICFTDVFTVVWDQDDPFTKQYMSLIEGDINSGSNETQGLSDEQEITPEGNILDSSFPRAVLAFIDDWNIMMKKMTKKRKAC